MLEDTWKIVFMRIIIIFTINYRMLKMKHSNIMNNSEVHYLYYVCFKLKPKFNFGQIKPCSNTFHYNYHKINKKDKFTYIKSMLFLQSSCSSFALLNKILDLLVDASTLW